MIRIVLFFFVLLLYMSCNQQAKDNGKTLQEIKLENKTISNAAIVRNPATLSQPKDTVNVAKMTFEHIRHRYGKVVEGTIVTHTFKFKNTGKAPLVISHAKSTCGCTVPEWPKEPIPVDGVGEIFVKFNTEHKENYQTKPIFITANTHPVETTLYLMGEVYKEKRE